MELRAYNSLIEIAGPSRERLGGKILQLLLAIAINRAGYHVTRERLSQDVDILMIGKRKTKYAIESKVTRKNHVLLGEKDIQGLRLAESDGYTSVLAALYIREAGEVWYVALAKGISPGFYGANWFRTRSLEPLQSDIRKEFLNVLYSIWPQVRNNPRPIPLLQQYLRASRISNGKITLMH
jgi:hypothetical protein